MTTSNNKYKKVEKSFWATLPGLLTGCAAVITAVGGLITVLVAAGVLGNQSETPMPLPTSLPSVPTQIIMPTNTPIPTLPSPTPVQVINVSGRWVGANGVIYIISQNGNLVGIQEVHPVYGITAEGQGQIVGENIDISYRSTDGSIGKALLSVSDNGLELTGTFTNLTMNISSPAYLYRQ